jgi:hypothetical protein
MNPKSKDLFRNLKKIKQQRAMIIPRVIGEKTIFPDLINKETINALVDMGGLQGQIKKAEKQCNEQDRPGSYFI